MGTHLAALLVTALGYWVAARYADDQRFAFGTGKVGDLAAFASAIGLGLSAGFIAFEAVSRLIEPVPIRFTEAIFVAAIGLAVNLASAWLLGGHDHHHHGHAHDHHDHHEHEHEHGHGHAHGEDQNLKAAYMHVLADVLTSVLAIAALLAGRYAGWIWMDALVAILGAGVIAWWSVGLLRRTAMSLLAADAPASIKRAVRGELERSGEHVVDLHLWSVGPGHYAVSTCILAHKPVEPETLNARLVALDGISHATVEVRRCCA